MHVRMAQVCIHQGNAPLGLAEDGRHVTIAVQGGLKAEIHMAALMVRRHTMTGSTLRPRSSARPRM